MLVRLHDDVAPAIKEWVDKKVKVIILSSKSVELQKLLLFAKKSDDFTEVIWNFMFLEIYVALISILIRMMSTLKPLMAILSL